MYCLDNDETHFKTNFTVHFINFIKNNSANRDTEYPKHRPHIHARLVLPPGRSICIISFSLLPTSTHKAVLARDPSSILEKELNSLRYCETNLIFYLLNRLYATSNTQYVCVVICRLDMMDSMLNFDKHNPLSTYS